MPTLKISLLGSPQITFEGAPIEVDTRKAIALLAYLALADEPQYRSSIATLLWPQSDEQRSRTALRRTLTALNKAIGKQWIEAGRTTLMLVRQPGLWVDIDIVREVERRLAQSHGGECPLPLEQLQAAADLFRGDFLEGFTLHDSLAFDEWQSFEASGWRNTAYELFQVVVGCCRAQGEYEKGITYARRWLALDSLHEPAHRALIEMYALAGQRGEALRQFEQCRRLLWEELGVTPQAETMALQSAVSAETLNETVIMAAPIIPQPRFQLPRQMNPLIGRERELEQINTLLEDRSRRLLTLIGPGGIGKTRLALEVAEIRQSHYKHGAAFVSLGTIKKADYLVATLADALSFSFYSGRGGDDAFKAQLLDFLSGKEMLLVLDNFEHVLEGAGLLLEILQAAPAVQLLVTSQERLNLRGEWLVEVAGLAVPVSLNGEANNASAVQLFIERARQLKADFEVDAADRAHVVRICQLVGGMPLGIELAASWVRLLSSREIADQIEESLDFLSSSPRDVPQRHRSLRAVFEHSWMLLSEVERQAFRNLSVFEGRFQAPAASAIAGASLPLLLALVNKSLLRRDDGWYELNQVLRQYATAKFRTELSRQEQDLIRTEHSLFYARFLREREQQLKGERQMQALIEIGKEIEDVRQAWDWLIKTRNVMVLDEVMETLYRFYEMRSWFEEGARAFEQAAVMLVNERGEERLLGRALSRQGRLLMRLSRPAEARAVLERSLKLLETTAEQREIAAVYGFLGVILEAQGDRKAAENWQQKSLALSKASGYEWGVAASLLRLGNTAYRQGDYGAARTFYSESLALRKQIGDRRGEALSLNNLGSVADMLGEYGEAQQLYHASIDIKQALGDRRGVAYSLNNLGYVNYLVANYAAAEQQLSESLHLFEEIGDRNGISYALTNLGNVAFGLADYDKAEAFYQESMIISQSCGNQLAEAFNLNHLATLYRMRLDLDQAMVYARMALAAGVKASAPPILLEVMGEFAAIMVVLGEWSQASQLIGLVLAHPSSGQTVRAQVAKLYEAHVSQLEAVESVGVADELLQKWIAILLHKPVPDNEEQA